MGWIIITLLLLVSLAVFAGGIRIVRPTHRMIIETLGKYSKTAGQGFNWIIPIIQQTTYVNITEQMVDVPEQTVQTADKLNTEVDAVVYYQVIDAKASEYNVDEHQLQLTSLARTTLRAVMGNMKLTECIQSREKINTDVEKVLSKETKSYGVSVLRVEVQRIEPPQDVQDAMNEVVKAEQERISAKDLAKAEETRADGQRMAEIKVAEGRRQAAILEAQGERQATILEAEGKAKAFRLIEDSFGKRAELLSRLEVTENSLNDNSKIVLTEK